MKGLKIYYLEDVKNDFDLIQNEFGQQGSIVYPLNPEERSKELSFIIEYLKSNEEEKEQKRIEIENIFISKKLDLLVFDYYLKGTEINSGDLFNDIIKNNLRFDDIPVIFLSVETRTDFFDIDHNSAFALKSDKIDSNNANIIYNRIVVEALKFKIILSKLKGDEGLKKSKSAWLTENF